MASIFLWFSMEFSRSIWSWVLNRLMKASAHSSTLPSIARASLATSWLPLPMITGWDELEEDEEESVGLVVFFFVMIVICGWIKAWKSIALFMHVLNDSGCLCCNLKGLDRDGLIYFFRLQITQLRNFNKDDIFLKRRIIESRSKNIYI